MQRVVICDIDGVLLTIPNWNRLEDFYMRLDECVPQDWAVHIIKGLHKQGLKIIFLTARDSKCRGYTQYQLQQLFDFPIHLDMRLHDDLRTDTEVKEDYIKEYLEKYKILLCIDDNINNCEMYKRYELPTLHVK